MSTIAGRNRACNCSPASVCATLRVVRDNSRTPISSSSARIAWLTADGETPSFFAARVKLRSSATVRNAVKDVKSTIHELYSQAHVDFADFSTSRFASNLVAVQMANKNVLDFTGKVALVTGAASGMGLATAIAFAEAGASVVLADVREELVKAETQKLKAAGHRVLALQCDVSNDAQVEQMVAQTVAEFGRLDAAFNNAGVMARIIPTAESTRDEWDRVININLRGVWCCLKYELQQMQKQGSGAIVNNASIGAQTGNPGISSYIASKHGVVGLTRTAALEYVKQGIRVNAINPGLIDTQIARDVVAGDEKAYSQLEQGVPIGRAGRPEEIAATVLWLCSPGASYIVGHALTVDGGLTGA